MMRLRIRWWCWLLLPAWSISFVADALPLGAPPPATLGIGDDFKPISVADYKGKVLVVTFWASWCGPCLNEMTVMEQLRRAAPDELEIVSINIESSAKFRQIKRVLRKELTLTLSNDADGKARRRWGVGPIPHMFMVDHTGVLAYEKRGYGDAFIDVLVDEANRLLVQRAQAIQASLPRQE